MPPSPAASILLVHDLALLGRHVPPAAAVPGLLVTQRRRSTGEEQVRAVPTLTLVVRVSARLHVHAIAAATAAVRVLLSPRHRRSGGGSIDICRCLQEHRRSGHSPATSAPAQHGMLEELRWRWRRRCRSPALLQR